MFNNFKRSVLSATLFVLALSAGSISSYGQNTRMMTRLDSLLMNPEYQNEIPLVTKLRAEGKSDKEIYNHIDNQGWAKRRERMKLDPSRYRFKKNEKGEWINVMTGAAVCTGDSLGVEGGNFGLWQGDTCVLSSVPTNCSATPWGPVTLPLANRITLSSTGPNDPCADLPGKNIPMPSPFGGQYSIKLGNNDINAESERLSYSFVVQPGDAKLVYQYATVLEDPSNFPHTPSEQPFFDFVILDANGDTIPCSFSHYTSGQGASPGFMASNLSNPACNNISLINGPSPVYYTTWTLVGVNLAGYVGTPVTVVCTTGDCSRCGHFGYTYLDFSCGAITTTQVCLGEDSVLLCAPGDPTFTYQWTTGQTSSCIIVNPQLYDTVTVHITQFGVCGFDITFVIQPTIVSPSFIDTVSCFTGLLSIINTTTVTNGSVTNWQWQFPGGNPSSSNQQNPAPIYYPPGIYTVSLTTTTQAGCIKTYTQTITVGTIPTADFIFTPKLSCEGIKVTFTDQTANASNWLWNFGDGPDTTFGQSPTHIYATNGTYSVTLIAQFPPCADTIVKPVLITAAVDTLQTPNVFTPNNDGMNDCFKPIMPAGVGDSLNDCIEMRVYDRWGIEVYESIGGLVCWDGKTKSNTKAKDGTYYYLIKFGESTYRGYVTLLRKTN